MLLPQRKILVTFALLFGLRHTSNAKCKTSFITTCDSVSDVGRYGTEKWTKLIIQDDPCTSVITNPAAATLTVDAFDKTPNLEHLYVARKVNEIKPGVFKALPDLTYLQLYKNEVKVLQKNTFSGFKRLLKLDASDNGIEQTNHGLFEDAVIHEVDFSNNKLTTLQVGQMNIASLKKLTLRNNFVTDLAVGCFHENLEHLDLDHNNLEVIDVRLFGLLTNLKTLILSNNKFQNVVKIPKMDSLESLDLSRNNILSIDRDAFSDLMELQDLSLSNNKLTQIFTEMFPKNSRIRVLKLHMNYLTNLAPGISKNLPAVKEVTLGGNPWICKCLLQMKKFLKANNVTFPSCDSDFFEGGEAPVCVIEDQTNCDTARITPTFLDEEYVINFRKLIQNYKCL